MSKSSYTQCQLSKPNGTGFNTQVVWIPTSLAKVGKNLQIKQDDDSWEDGWVVAERYGTQEMSVLDLQRKAHRRFDEVLEGCFK